MTIQREPRQFARTNKANEGHFTVQQMIVLIAIVWLATAAILPVVLPDASGVVTQRPSTFADWSPTLTADERIETAG
jgi:hypothetical protein